VCHSEVVGAAQPTVGVPTTREVQVEDHDVGRLESNIQQVQTRLREYIDRDRFSELIPIIKKPGWTTPAEFYLVATTVDTIGRQLDVIDQLTEGLLEGSRLVEVKERAAV
jgi:hypothetical protein